MGIPGYAGSVLYIDLTSGKITREPLDPELVERFLGGWGINNKLAYDLISPNVDPISPQNKIILGTGPFGGTMIPGGAELLATTKYPINGAFATGAGGGSFALRLKTAGYDHVVVSGQAERPVYLKLAEEPEICDAGDLWGRDIFATVDELRLRHEPCSVVAIGQAGENLVKYSVTSIDKGGTIGRGGLPTVMGSKNLKAFVAIEGETVIQIADRRRLGRLVDTLVGRMMSWAGREPLMKRGIGGEFLEWWGETVIGTQNLTEVLPITSEDMERYKAFWDDYEKCRHTLACATCLLGDKEVTRFGGLSSYGNALGEALFEYAFKSATEGLGRAMEFTNTLNKYGIDIMTFSSVVGLMNLLFRKGIISGEDTGGLELGDDVDSILELARLVAHRERFGDVLADGIVGAVERLGKGKEYAYHIKGQGLLGTGFDPRTSGLGTMEMTQVTNPRGAHVASGGSPAYLRGRPPSDFIRHGERMGCSEETLKRAVGEDWVNFGRYTRCSEDWYSLFNCMGLCNRAMVNRFYHVRTIAELYGALSGIEKAPAELMKVAERCYNLWKVLNVRAGFGRKDDQAPEVWFTPLKGEEKEYQPADYFGNPLTREAMDRFLDDYYDERGWDKETSAPTPEKLKELGLEDVSLAQP